MDNYTNENLTLGEKITEIKVAMEETKNIRMYKRYLVILKHLEGNSNISIANMVSLEQHAVRDYIRNYKVNGLTGLEMKHSTGAPRKLSKEQELPFTIGMVVLDIAEPIFLMLAIVCFDLLPESFESGNRSKLR